ncbi:type I inositol 1,4,5-trisphosphate 5-phosphatase [Phthorimaea operculella]|nr:type I inositol 1,4,5-trisphosphate 5-phosphatase [Phthorimaea operculella]
MGSDKVPMLLITANVGSIFEEPSVMLPIWTSEFLAAVSRMDPKFIALHLQEVGGKAYEKSMQYVQDFVERLCGCPELRLYDKIRIFLDEDFSAPDKFTALGNMYFAHSSLTELKIWDWDLGEYVPVIGKEVHSGNIEKVSTKEKAKFPQHFFPEALGNMYFAHSSLTELKIWDWDLGEYVPVIGKEVHSGNIEKVSTKEKAKFPQHFFPECKWSRKGFLRTRWVIRGTAVEFINIHLMIRGTAVEFINIHLFHDASNLLACEPFPSVYCRSRRRALRHTLRHIHSDVNAAPYFIFGDFNFRTDTGGVVKKLTEELTACRIQNGDKVDSSKLQYRSKTDDKVVLTVGKKEFSHSDHQTIFREPWLQRFDRELEALRPHLYEFPVKFPPTYPFEEDAALPTDYMKTRCPSWCDRVLLSQAARLLIAGADRTERVERPDNRHLHNSRKSVTDSSESSGRVSSSDSSPARAGSPAKTHQSSPQKLLEKKQSISEVDALSVPGIAISRKSIADPTAVHQAIQNRANESEGSPVRRKLVRNQSEGSGAVCGGGGGDVSAELRRLVEAPARRRAEYGMLGLAACTGDHKPIYLRVMLQSERGNVRQEFHSETSPKYSKTDDDIPAESVVESPTSRYIHFNCDSPNAVFKETDI